MSKLILSPVTNPEQVGVFNSNFDEIARYVNEEMFKRSNIDPGDVNQLEVDLDMNSHQILNVGEPLLGNAIVTKEYVDTRDQSLQDQIDNLPLPASGVYTPSIVSSSGVDSVVVSESSYSRVGDMVTVFGRMDVDPTQVGGVCSVVVSLPLPSSLTQDTDAVGVIASVMPGGPSLYGPIMADGVNAKAMFIVGSAAIMNSYFHFHYKIK